MLDFGEDDSGLFCKYLRRDSGYYIDVGASELFANGDIKLKSGFELKRITESAIEFNDGSTLDADLIVLATGYGSMNGWAAQLISQDVADKVGKVWGLGSDTTKVLAHGKVSLETCGSQPNRQDYGFMAVTSTSLGIIRNL